MRDPRLVASDRYMKQVLLLTRSGSEKDKGQYFQACRLPVVEQDQCLCMMAFRTNDAVSFHGRNWTSCANDLP